VLYSIGYQGMRSPEALIAQLSDVGVKVLLDVRSKPFSRFHYREFDRPKLEALFRKTEIAYHWVGDRLGGFGEIAPDDIERLAEWHQGTVACLMCMERNPDECHRKYVIAKALEERFQVEVVHLPLPEPEVAPSLF
jgi:uncharacterized protein (DUF488 family)